MEIDMMLCDGVRNKLLTLNHNDKRLVNIFYVLAPMVYESALCGYHDICALKTSKHLPSSQKSFMSKT